jgi:hypothetical protein
MLELNETLFVEHKGPKPEYPLAKAVASFANQLGGWVLVNVNGDPPHPLGDLPEWITRAPSPVDAVRDRLNGLIEPMPPFEARTIEIGDGKVLVMRVYESADTPHILRDGAIYVRGVAQDRRTDPIYRPMPIQNQQALLELVRRGERATERVGSLLDPSARLPLANGGIQLSFSPSANGLVVDGSEPMIWVRLAPHTLTGRYAGWARSHDALKAANQVLQELGDFKQPPERTPHPQGFWLRGRLSGEREPLSEGGRPLGAHTFLSVDAVGIVAASVSFRRPEHPDFPNPITLGAFGEMHLAPVIRAPMKVLTSGEILGRVACHIWIRGLEDVLRIEENGTRLRGAGTVPFEREFTLPTAAGEVEDVAQAAARAYGRMGGLETFE